MRFMKRGSAIFARKISIIVLPILAICGIITAVKIINTNALSDEWAQKGVVASEVAKTQYVTILDESLRVIASSNPNTPIDAAYTPDEEGQTEAKIYKDQNLLVYIEVALDNEKLPQLNSENNYYVPISNNLVPNSSIVIDQPGGMDEPQDLLSNSTVTALGGVFKDENEYKLRINFQNFEDQADIAASYQFNANFSEDITTDGYGFKALDFGDAGTVQVLLSETPVEPAPAKHKLSAVPAWTDDTRQKHSVWTITLDDLQESPSVLGNVSFAMPEGIITVLPYDDESKLDIALYADDVKLEVSCSNNGDSANCSYTKDGQTVAQINFEKPQDTCSWPRIARCESNFVSNGTIEFGNNNTAITGVRQWKIAINGTNSEALDNTKDYALNSNFQSSEENLSATISLAKTLQESTASVSIDSYVSNGETISYPQNGDIKDILPESLNKTYMFSGSSDIDTVKIQPRAEKLGDYIYAYAIEMSNDEEASPENRMVKNLFTDGLKFTIDGTEQHFSVDEEGLVDYGTLGIIANKYGINYQNKNESINKVLDGGLLLVSDGLNPEGDHYYIYLPKEQIEKLSSTVPTTQGWFEDKTKTILIQCAAPEYSQSDALYTFDSYDAQYKWYDHCGTDSEEQQLLFEKDYSVGDIEFDILNAAGATTEIKTKESLFFVKLKQDFRSTSESTPTEQFSSQITIKNSVGTQKKKEAWQKFSFTGYGTPVNFTSSALPQQSMQWSTEIYAPWLSPLVNKVDRAQYQSPKFDLDINRNIERTHPLGNNGKTPQYDYCDVNLLAVGVDYTALYPCYGAPSGVNPIRTSPMSNTNSSTVWYTDYSHRITNTGTFTKGDSLSPLYLDEVSTNGYFRGNIGTPPFSYSTTDINLAGNNIRSLASTLNDSNNQNGLIRFSLATDAKVPEAHIAYGFPNYSHNYTWLVIDLKADARKEQINTKKLLSTKTYRASNGDYIIEKEWQVSVKNGATVAQQHTRNFGGAISIIDKFEDQTTNSNGEPIGDYTDYELTQISTNGTDVVRCEIGSYSCNQYASYSIPRTYHSSNQITDWDFEARWYAFDRDSSRNMRTVIETAPFTAAENQQEYTNYKNEHYGIPDRNMTNGFYVNLYNLAQNDETVEISYVTRTNLTEFLEGEGVGTAESRIISYTNKAMEAAQLETSTAKEFKDTINYAAQLSATHSSRTAYDPYTGRYTTEITVGMTPADEVRATEFIAGYKDGEREHVLEKSSDRESVEALTKIATPNIGQIYLLNKDDGSGYVITVQGSGWNVVTTPNENDGENGELFTVSIKKENGGTIEPNTTFVIEYSLKIDMETPEFDGNGFRYISDYYNGDSLDIYTNTKAERSFDGQPMSDDKTDPSQNIESLEDEYEPYIYDNRLVTFAGASVVAEYIKPRDPSVVKDLKKESDSVYDFTVTVKMPSNGNTEPLVMDLRDNLSFGLNSEGAEQQDLDRLSNIISNHSKYTNISVSRKEQYEYSQTRTLPSNETLVENANISTNENINVTSDSGVNTYIRYPNGSIQNFDITVSNIQHDDIVTAKYTLIIDWEGVYDELKRIVAEETGSRLDQIFVSASLKILNESFEVSAPSKISRSSSTISVGSIIPKITKNYTSNDSSKSEWTLKVDSKAKTADKLIVEDSFTAQTDGQTNETITQALEVTDIVITDGETVIYDSTQDNQYPTGLDASKLSVETSNNTLKVEFIGDELLDGNKSYLITYHTDINPSKLAEADIESSGSYTVHNESSIKDGSNETNSNADSDNIDYSYPITLEKYSTFDESDPAKANYSVFYSTGILPRYDVVIADSASADQLVLSNLSIENLVVKINDVEYTPAELPEEYRFTLLNELTDSLKLYKLEAAKIPANTNIEIDYSLTLNKEQYLEQGGEGNNPNKINNTVNYADRHDEVSANAESSIIAPEIFTKTYNFTPSETSDGKTYLDWSFNLNLLENMNQTPDTVVVKDELQESLNYVDDSIKIYRKIATEDGYVRDAELLEGQDYQFALNGRTIEVTILNPSETPIIEIAITTECLSSISNLQNKSSLTINGESRATISKPIATVFTRYTAGTVTSRNRAFYTIVGQKYLDGELSEKQFDFSVKELDCATKDILNEQTVQNDEQGNIEFGSFQATEPVSRCFELSEIANKDGYKFDNRTYQVSVTVSDKNGDLVTETSIEGADEIIFENETTPEDSKSPNTTDTIKYSFATLAIITTGLATIMTTKAKLRRR